MKKSILIFAVSVLFFSCSNKKPEITTKLVIDGHGVNDKSYNAAAWDGVLSFYGDTVGEETGFGTLYDVVIMNNTSQLVSDLKALAFQKTDVLVMAGSAFSDALKTVVPIFYEQKFITIDTEPIPCANVQNYGFASEEGSYLVGALIAMKAQDQNIVDPVFGFIGGISGDTVADFECGYIQGIHSVLPDAKIYDHYVESWNRPDLASQKAGEWYDSGVYAIYSVAGLTGSGTIAQAVRLRKAGKNVWAIGVDRDQFEEGIYGSGQSAVLTSMVKRVDRAVYAALKSVQNEKFKGGSRTLSLKDGAVGYTKTNPELGEAIIKITNQIQGKIIQGKISVNSTRKNRIEAEKLLKSAIRE